MLKEVKRLTPLMGEGWRWRGENGTRDKVTKRKRGKEAVEMGEGPCRDP